MSSCFGLRKQRSDDERQPLLPQYRDDTTLQRELHQKLHSYQMIRALSKGFMPSNEQTIVNLRTLLGSDILNPENVDLSDSGRLLIRQTRRWLEQFIELLMHKNSEDQIQDFIWFLSKARISVDVEDIARTASKARVKADTAAGGLETITCALPPSLTRPLAYNSLHTVGSLLLTNSDFRLFLSDVSTIGREVFKDAAFTLSEVAEEAGKQVEPSKEEQAALKRPGLDEGPAPTEQDLENGVAEVSKVVGNGVARVAKEAESSLAEKVTGDEKEALMHRLQKAVLKLRKRPDYSESVSVISKLIQRYSMVYSRALQETVETVQADVHENRATDRALLNFWTFLSSFGDHAKWEELEQRFKQVMSHSKNDPEFEELMTTLGNSLQELLTDPGFFDHAEERFGELREKSRNIGTDSSLRNDLDGLLAQAQTTFHSIMHDKDVANLFTTSTKIATILSPAHQYTNDELVTDAVHVFIPLLINAIQYIPIPRLEVSTPEVDLLLENLILEPGKTVNHTSFFPYKLRLETYNDLEIRKARFKTTAHASSNVTIKIDGLSVRADEIGFWLRAHAGLLRLADEGIASFQLDERGIDIHLDVEIGKERLEKIVTLNKVRVHIHKLNYTLRKSKFAFLGWILKPLLRPVIRKVMERQLAHAIADSLHAANRELLYARERLRATRIADPQDLVTFFRAIAARLTPAEDPDVYTRVGVSQPGKGVFKGVYAPGSVVKLWNEEALQAAERIEDYEQGGWRNDVFDVHTTYMT